MGFMLMFLPITRVQYVFNQKELNLLQIVWLELLKDYDMSVLYHHDKVNVVVDALSHMTMGSVSHIYKHEKDLSREVQRFSRGAKMKNSPDGGSIVHHNSESSLVVGVKSKQHLYFALMEFKRIEFSASLMYQGGMVY